MLPSPQLFCELYIDTDETTEEIEAAVKRAAREVFRDMNVNVVTYRNEDFEPSARGRSPYSPIECSRYCVEIEALSEPTDRAGEFQSDTATLVRLLRAGRRFATASCDFEEVVAALTGWNWTRDKPEPPGR
jgi:hypothetical protein